MNENIVTTVICGKKISYCLEHSDSLCFFDSFKTDYDPAAPVLKIPKKYFAERREIYPPEIEDEEIELRELSYMTSDLLIPEGFCLFHTVAMLINGRAWLFTAPAGTGKTTQYVLWKKLFGDRVRLINGDKPFLGIGEDGKVWVRPSPWRGKENMGRMESAPLGGVIYLRQGAENKIRPLECSEALIKLYNQFLYNAKDEESVKKVCEILEAIIKNGNLWMLTNKGDKASAVLTYETIKEAL